MTTRHSSPVPCPRCSGVGILAGSIATLVRNRSVAATPARGRRHLSALATVVATGAAFLAPAARVAANTVVTVVNVQTDLTAPTTYSPSGTPTSANDVEFIGAYNPAAFTLNSSQTFGSLDDLSATAITISDPGSPATLTLGANGGTDAVTGSQPADLIYVATGSNLTISPGSGILDIVLGQAGNFDIAGTAAIGTALSGSGVIRTGAGSLTLSGAMNIAGTFTNSGTAPTVYPSVGTGTAPAGSTFINGTVNAGSVTGIVQNGTSDLVLGNLGNTYAAGITIQNGIVIFNNTIAGSSNSLGNSANTIFLGNASTVTNATMNFAATVGGGIAPTGGTATFSNGITVGSKTGEGANVISASDYNLALSGAISLTGGDLTFAPANTGTSTISFSGGITGVGNLFISDVAGAAGNVVTLSGNPINNTGSITFNNATINGVAATGANTGTNTVSANIGSSVNQVTENSTNPVTLSGTNTYTGGTAINLGTLEFGKTASMPSTGAVTVNSGGTIAVAVGGTGQFTNATSGAGSLGGIFSGVGAGSATIILNPGSSVGVDTGSGSVIYAGDITNSGLGLAKLGANTLTLTGANTYNGLTTIAGGTLQIGSGGTAGMLGSGSVIDKGTLAFDRTDNYGGAFSQSISGTGGLSVLAGLVTLTGANTYTGPTAVTAGTLQAGIATVGGVFPSTGAFGGNSAVTLTQGTTLDLNGFNETIGSLADTGTGATVTSSTAGAVTLITGTNNGSTTFSGVVQNGAGTVGLTAFGFGNTLTLKGANTYTGTTTVMGGVLNLGGAGTIGSISSSSPLVLGGVAGGGTFAYTRTGTNTQTFAGTTINQGGNAITESLPGQTINLGTLTGNHGGTVDIGSTGVVTTTSGNANGIIGGFATFGGKTTWAVAPATPGGAITGLASTSYTESGTALTSPANYLNQNIDVNASQTLTGAINPNSIRFNTNAAETLTLTGTNVIATGGILVTPTEQTASTITGGTLLGPAGGQLSITSAGLEGTGTVFTIASYVGDNGAPSSVAVSAAANGRALTLNNGNNSFSGGFYLNGGGVNTGGGTSLGVGTVYFGNNNIYTGAAGGGILFGTATVVISSGLISAANGANASNGDISGNSGGIWNLTGVPGTSATWAGIVGSYSGGRIVNFAVNGGTEIIGNTQIGMSQAIANAGTYQLGTGYSGSLSNSKQNVGLVLGGGTFLEFGNYAGSTNQPFNSGLTVNAGASTVTVNNNGGAGTVVNLASATTRAIGGTVDFNLPAGAQTSLNGIVTNALNTNGILGGYATVGGTDWATNATGLAGGNVIGLSSSTINSYTPSTAGTTSPGATANVDFQASNTSPYTAQTINSLRFNTAAANTLTLSGSNVIASAGLLVTPGVGANLTTITGGTLGGFPGGDLIVIQDNIAAGLEIDSAIADNGNATGLTKSGPGLLTLTGTNTYTGKLVLNAGILNAATAGIDGGSTTNGITFNGGTLQAASGGITTAKGVTMGVNGGTVDTNGNAVTLSGAVINAANSPNLFGAGLRGGFVATGVGALTKIGSGTLTLSSATDSFSGGIIINNGTVQDGNASAATLGSGYVTFGGSNVPALDLNGNSPTIAGLIGARNNGLVTSSAGTTPVVTLNGVISESFGGVIQNGLATSVGLTVNLTNSGAVQTFTGANTYTGPPPSAPARCSSATAAFRAASPAPPGSPTTAR